MGIIANKVKATKKDAERGADDRVAVARSSSWNIDGAPIFAASNDELVSFLPFPRADANKYTRGKLTLVAGSNRYPGAACLSAAAAERMGAGYVEVVVPASLKLLLVSASPSLVISSRKGWDACDLSVMAPSHPQALCIGPGFDSAEEESEALVFAALKNAACVSAENGLK